MHVCVCGGREAFLVLLLKCCCSIIINYFHITPVEQWKYNMCDVPLLAMSGRGLATLCDGGDDGDTVAVTDNSILPGGRTAHPRHARPSPDREHQGRGEEYSSSST